MCIESGTLTLYSVLGTLREFTEEEVGVATQSFTRLVGKGSFGSVYKGEIQHIPVAVKVIDPVRVHTQHIPH